MIPEKPCAKCDCGHEQKCPEENYWRLRILHGHADAPYGVRYQLCELLREEAARQCELARTEKDEMHGGYEPPRKMVKRAIQICDPTEYLDRCRPSYRTQQIMNIRDAMREGVHDIYGAIISGELGLEVRKPDQAAEDPEALPKKMRTRHERWDGEGGSFHEITPITVLRLPCCGVLAEIVRIEYWIGHKADGMSFYQVNRVDPHAGNGFAKKQLNTVSLDYIGGNRENSEFARVEALMKEAEAYIQRLQSQE